MVYNKKKQSSPPYTVFFYMASSVGGQDEPNARSAIRAVSRRKIHIEQACSIEMAG